MSLWGAAAIMALAAQQQRAATLDGLRGAMLRVDGEAVPPGKAGIQTVVAATGGARLTLTRPSWLRGRRLDVTVIHRGWLGLEYSEHASGNFVMIATSGMGAAAMLLELRGHLLHAGAAHAPCAAEAAALELWKRARQP